MQGQEKISSSQCLLLFITLVTATAVLFVPAITAQEARQDGWLSALVFSTLFALLVAVICTSLGLRFPGRTVIQYSPEILGRFLGKLAGLGYIFFFIHINSIIVREFGDFLTTVFLPDTPIDIFVATLLLLGASAVRNGLEVIARMNQFVFPLLLFSYMLIIVLVARDMDLHNLLPVLEGGIGPVLKGSFSLSAFRGEVCLILMLLPSLNNSKEATLTTVKAVIWIGILLTVDTVATLAVFGPDITSVQVFPFLNLARYISLGNFVERIESLVILIWVAGVVVKVSLIYYVAALAAAQWFNLREYRPVVLPIGMLIGVLSIIGFSNSRELVEFIAKIWPPYGFSFELILPTVLLLAAMLRKKGGTRDAQKTRPASD
ncbi:MAG: endospore germination permease [Clostridia bacterium]|nr:endospore germination permease [Clostridia bacterium]